MGRAPNTLKVPPYASFFPCRTCHPDVEPLHWQPPNSITSAWLSALTQLSRHFHFDRKRRCVKNKGVWGVGGQLHVVQRGRERVRTPYKYTAVRALTVNRLVSYFRRIIKKKKENKNDDVGKKIGAVHLLKCCHTLFTMCVHSGCLKTRVGNRNWQITIKNYSPNSLPGSDLFGEKLLLV